MDWKDRLGGAPVASFGQASVTGAAATSIQLVPSNGYRTSLRIANIGPQQPYVAFGAQATSTKGFPVPSLPGMVINDYLGPVTVSVPSVNGASGLVAFAEFGSS